jgi:serine/threonine protein phosphatase PrpC
VSGGVAALQPVYLVLDVGKGPEEKRAVVDGALPRLVDVVREEPRAYARLRVALLTFADDPFVQLGLSDPATLRELRPPTPGTAGRNWQRVFRKLAEQIAADGRTQTMERPVVLFVADGPPDDPDGWREVFDDLVSRFAAVVVPAGYGAAPPELMGALAHPDERAPGRAAPERDHPLEVVARAVAALRDAPPADAPPPVSSAPTWTGGFTPYAVGDAGRAATLVRPVPDPQEWRQPDTVLDGVAVPDGSGRYAVELRAASVRGLSHRHYGKVRQDGYAFTGTPDGRHLVIAVSDGVSAASHAHRAAQAVCHNGCNLIVRQLEQLPPEKLDWGILAGTLAHALVRNSARLAGVEEGTMTPADAAVTHAATALFAVVDLKPENGLLPVQVFAIGDSSAWVLHGGTEWWPLQPVKNAGAVIASSRTGALPLLGAELAPPVATELGPDDVLVLMTDGIADPLGDGRGEVGRFLAETWRCPPAPLAFAAQVDFGRKTHDDDRTAVAVWPAGLGS